MVQVKFDCQSDHRAEDTSSDCSLQPAAHVGGMVGLWQPYFPCIFCLHSGRVMRQILKFTSWEDGETEASGFTACSWGHRLPRVLSTSAA